MQEKILAPAGSFCGNPSVPTTLTWAKTIWSKTAYPKRRPALPGQNLPQDLCRCGCSLDRAGRTEEGSRRLRHELPEEARRLILRATPNLIGMPQPLQQRRR